MSSNATSLTEERREHLTKLLEREKEEAEAEADVDIRSTSAHCLVLSAHCRRRRRAALLVVVWNPPEGDLIYCSDASGTQHCCRTANDVCSTYVRVDPP